MSVNELFSDNNYSIQSKNLLVKNQFKINENINIKSWNPANADSVTVNNISSIQLNITMNTTALLAGYLSGIMTVNNNLVSPTSTILGIVSQCSDIPTSFDNSLTVPCPVVFINNITNGSFGFQILNNGYGPMTATCTLQINFLVT